MWNLKISLHENLEKPFALISNFNTKTVVNNSFSLTSLHPYELQLKKLNPIYLGVKLGTVKLKDLFNLREKVCVKARNHMGPKN